jgi:hypothetical protein
MAVLPLVNRLRLDTTCLVIGTMAPDFEYFARVKQASAISHTWLGLIAWNVPVTIVLALAFHHLVKWPLVLVAPRVIARRAAVHANRPWGPWSWRFAAACVVSALIGALTHLIWDGFTHSDGLITPHVPFLRTPIDLPYRGEDMVLHRVLQHASTVIGTLVIAIVVGRALYRTAPVELPERPRIWPRVIAAGCLGAGIALALLRLRRLDDIGNVVVVLISGALLGVLITSVVLRRVALRSIP